MSLCMFSSVSGYFVKVGVLVFEVHGVRQCMLRTR